MVFKGNHSEETKQKIRNSLSDSYASGKRIPWSGGLTKETDERVRLAVEKRTGLKRSEETRKRMSKSHMGKISSIKGSHLSEIHKQRIKGAAKINPNYGMRNKKQSEEAKLKMHNKILSEETKIKIGIASKGRIFSEETRKKLSENSRKRWQNPEYRERTIKATLLGLMKRPTSYEKKLIELFVMNNLPFAYTGNGTYLVNFKNPDFIIENQKIAIEVFYSWFKIRDYGSVENYKEFCRNKYEPAGWKVVFIDESELKCENWENVCLNKIGAIQNVYA